MRTVIFVFLILSLTAVAANAQWTKQTVNTSAGFRGLDVVSEKVIWASGTGGTVIKTVDGGGSWTVMTVPGAEKLDFRDIEAFDAKTAYILSIGNGEISRIYKTTDGGSTWTLQFKNTNEKAFFDAIACWDSKNCIAMSDPVDNRYVLVKTTDGQNWKHVNTDNMPPAKTDEAAFAASGTCLISHGKSGVFLVTGGSDARAFHSLDRGKSWTVSDTQIVKGTPASGIFSIAMYDTKNGVIVGGDYAKPNDKNNNLAFTGDGGSTWTISDGFKGYRSGAAYIDRTTIVAVGSSGSDITRDGGKTWKSIDRLSYNTVAANSKRAVWAVGDKGMVAKMQ